MSKIESSFRTVSKYCNIHIQYIQTLWSLNEEIAMCLKQTYTIILSCWKWWAQLWQNFVSITIFLKIWSRHYMGDNCEAVDRLKTIKAYHISMNLSQAVLRATHNYATKNTPRSRTEYVCTKQQPYTQGFLCRKDNSYWHLRCCVVNLCTVSTAKRRTRTSWQKCWLHSAKVTAKVQTRPETDLATPKWGQASQEVGVWKINLCVCRQNVGKTPCRVAYP